MILLSHLTDAEQRLFSAIIVGGPSEAIAATAAGLKFEHFSTPEAAAVWRAIAACASLDKATDFPGIAQRLKLDRGGAWELTALDGMEPTSARRPVHVAAVIGAAKRRRVSDALLSATEAAQAATDWPETLAGIEPHLAEIQRATADTRAHRLADFIDGAKNALERNERPGAIASPFPGWDRAAGKIAGGDLAIVAARPGDGKTAFALQFADGVARAGRGVLFVSLEMPGDQLVTRVAMQRAGRVGEICAGISADALQAAKAARRYALDEIAELDGRLVIGEHGDCGSLAQIEARAMLLANAACGLGLVVVDYLQLLEVPGELRRDIRERQVAEMSRRAKKMALSLGAPVLLLAQLNRGVEQEKRSPKLSDLRESGAIEQDADRVWFLHPPSDAIAAADAPDVLKTLLQAKARHDSPGLHCNLRFRRPQVRFYAK